MYRTERRAETALRLRLPQGASSGQERCAAAMARWGRETGALQPARRAVCGRRAPRALPALPSVAEEPVAPCLRLGAYGALEGRQLVQDDSQLPEAGELIRGGGSMVCEAAERCCGRAGDERGSWLPCRAGSLLEQPGSRLPEPASQAERSTEERARSGFN